MHAKRYFWVYIDESRDHSLTQGRFSQMYPKRQGACLLASYSLALLMRQEALLATIAVGAALAAEL